MAWTYNAQPFPDPWPYIAGQAIPQSCVDTVRFLIGDTDTSDQQLQDGEIQGTLTWNNGDPYQAAIESCRALALKYARQADKTVGDLHLVNSQRSKAYAAMVQQIIAQSLRHGAPTPYAGGISIPEIEEDRTNTDLVQPSFTKGFMDDPGTAPDYGDFNSGYDGFDRLTPGG